MNVLFIISSLSIGGAERQTVTDANLLYDNSKNDKSRIHLLYFKEGPLENSLGRGIICSKLRKNSYFSTAFRFAQYIKRNRIDIVHASLFSASIISSLAGLFVQTKVVWHFHSHEYDVPWYSRLAFIICARFKSVKKILFVNEELMNYLAKRFFLPRKKLEVLYNSTSHENYSPFQRNGDGIDIGYVGRVIELKRVHYLIELAEYLLINEVNNFIITIVGDGDKRNELEDITKERGLEEHIVFTGFQEDTQKYYSKFDIFINPSSEECLSIALIDAGIMGIPSVAFNVGGNGEIIENKKSGLIVNTKEELFEKVKDLIADRNLRSYYGENAREVCLNKFSQETRKNRLIEISQSL